MLFSPIDSAVAQAKCFRCKIGIPHEDIESNDAVIFGFMVAVFLKHFREAITEYQPLVVAHFHEWQAGAPLPFLPSSCLITSACRSGLVDVSPLETGRRHSVHDPRHSSGTPSVCRRLRLL